MTEEERVALAISLLNDTLGMDDVPKFIIDRVSVAVILLDPYDPAGPLFNIYLKKTKA